MNLKECWIEADCLRKRISRKEEELKNLRMCIDGMTGKGISNMPHTASPDPHKIEAMVSHILELEEEIKNSRSMLNKLIDEMSRSTVRRYCSSRKRKSLKMMKLEKVKDI